ncbi:MAG: hypothetical protein K2O05_01775, partial [Anaeroplasmataceae bacterium]|nr:hypothetical protein [Anaeroplasmataceae bacterium]
YSYNINHIRTKKITQEREINYILDGSRILKEKRNNYTTHVESYIDDYATIDSYEEELEYIYSNQGIIGFDYIKNGNSKRYYYNKNILGDILEIYDEEGNIVAKYSYDAYGNHKIILNKDDIANINPFRYRSYYYDIETNLYYLNSRYYDPEVCRFISMDLIEYINPETLNGLNLYAYCNNNPVMNVDPEGNAWWNWLISGIQLVAGIVLCATGVGAGLGASLIVGGVMGIAMQFVSPAISQIVGGFGSLSSGFSSIMTGISLFSYGPVGWVLGTIGVVAGAISMAMGTAEIQEGFGFGNWIKDAGISSGWYAGLYIGSSIATTVVNIAGPKYMNSTHGQYAYANQKLNGIIKHPSRIQKYSISEFNSLGSKANPSKWTYTSAKNGKGMRIYDARGNAIRYNLNGSRFDFNHFFGVPYWVVSN